MCTVLYHAALGLITKNRDKHGVADEEIVRKAKAITVRTRGADYDSLGVNRHGCAFVSTAINPPEWTALIEAGKDAAADAVLRQAHAGLARPTGLVSSLLDQVRSVADWTQALKRENARWMGYNLVLADPERAVLVEVAEDQMAVRELEKCAAVTNHFRELKYGPLSPKDYANSWERFEYAAPLVNAARTRSDIEEIIHPRETERRGRIWRAGAFHTVSSTILNFRSGTLSYSANINQPYLDYHWQPEKGFS